jgi:hypothetical protein
VSWTRSSGAAADARRVFVVVAALIVRLVFDVLA